MFAGCDLGSGDKEPVCEGHAVGETWEADDGCNTCQCTEEGESCTLMACMPDCEGHLPGDTWDAEDGCNTCSCTEEGIACTEMACLPDCEGHALGETWDADDGCNTCHCTEDGVGCTVMACLPDCDGHELGDSWDADDGCNTCTCIEEGIACTAMACLPDCDGHELGESWTAEDGCNVCECSMDGIACTDDVCPPDCDGHEIGETWDADDGCNTCTCTEEGIACTAMACLPDCDGHELGETWDAEDGCNTCTCTENGIACTEMACAKTCDEVAEEYHAMLDGASECAEHADCQYLWAVCGEGMGSCYEIVNMSISQEDIAAIEQEYLAANCQLWDCACTLPPAVMCADGVCVAGPECDGHKLGETWDADDGCNVCTCTPEGIACTAMWCPPETCEEIQQTYADLVADNSSCEVTDDCQVLWGQCGQGLGGCYEAVNGNVTQEELSALGSQFAEQGCTQWVCDCTPPPEVECKDNVCNAIFEW